MSLTRMTLTRVLSALLCLLLAPALAGAADKPNGAQKRAAERVPGCRGQRQPAGGGLRHSPHGARSPAHARC